MLKEKVGQLHYRTESILNNRLPPLFHEYPPSMPTHTTIRS